MAKKFNLADFLPGTGNVSNLDTMEISLIPWENIRANDANFYIVGNVEDLRNSIQMHGLLDPITVTPDEEDDRYLLISGHRRFKAWGLLRQEDPERYEKIPAMIRRFESKALSELALIMANSATRVLTPAELSRQAERVERLFYDLKEAGYEFPGRMRDQVAAACKVSASKLARLKVIREKLSPSWAPLWEEGKLPEVTAYELAQAAPEIQERIFKANSGKAPNCHNLEDVLYLMKNGSTYDGTQVKKPGCDKCTHGDAFLRHDLASGWDKCTGTRCCLKCDSNSKYTTCERACSKAKKVKTEKNAKAKAQEEAKQKKQAHELRERIRESAERLLRAADAAGLEETTLIPSDRWYKKPVSWLRAAADPDGDIGHLYYNPIDSKNLDVPAVAKLLQCSTDYLYGLTDDPKPRPYPDGAEGLLLRWIEGTPVEPGRYLCTVVWDDGAGGNGTSEQTCDWKDGQWKCYGRDLDGMFTVVRWWPLPPKFEYRMLRDEIAEEGDDEDEG